MMRMLQAAALATITEITSLLSSPKPQAQLSPGPVQVPLHVGRGPHHHDGFQPEHPSSQAQVPEIINCLDEGDFLSALLVYKFRQRKIII